MIADWQANLENRATLGTIAGNNISAMLFDDAVADAQPEAGSLPNALGGVEGVENLLGILNTGPRIMEFGADKLVFAVDLHLQHATGAALDHRIECIVDNVEKNLFQLVWIGIGMRNIGI